MASRLKCNVKKLQNWSLLLARFWLRGLKKNAMQNEKEVCTESREPPGAARYGNFISYYTFHPPEERTKLIDFSLLSSLCTNDDITILDVGCNTGELTREVHTLLQQNSGRACYVLAIDLDPCLIERAKETVSKDSRITYEVLDIIDPTFLDRAHQFLSSLGKSKFDLAFMFSVTMWIHLNGGDEGLEKSLISIAGCSISVIVEPQPWKCYRATVRRLRRAGSGPFESFQNLKWRSTIENDILNVFQMKCNFIKIDETNRTGWGRKIYVLQRKTGLK